MVAATVGVTLMAIGDACISSEGTAGSWRVWGFKPVSCVSLLVLEPLYRDIPHCPIGPFWSTVAKEIDVNMHRPKREKQVSWQAGQSCQ